jgi:hypothetical protein
MRADRLLHIIGAGRHITAATLQAQHDLHGRENNAVNANEKDGNRLHERISMAKFHKKATLVRNKVQKVAGAFPAPEALRDHAQPTGFPH